METTIYYLGSRVENKNHIEQQIANEIQSSVWCSGCRAGNGRSNEKAHGTIGDLERHIGCRVQGFLAAR